jgi:hypothetical protein
MIAAGLRIAQEFAQYAVKTLVRGFDRWSESIDFANDVEVIETMLDGLFSLFVPPTG